MIYINEYTIRPSTSFEIELENIYRHIAIDLKEPIVAKRIYNKVIKKIYSLQYFPERYVKINIYKNRKRNLRKILINQYVVIYEVDKAYKEIIILHIFHSTQNYLNEI